MLLVFEISDYSLHHYIYDNVTENQSELERTLEAAISIYCRNISNLEIEGRVLMRYELTDAALSHKLKRWFECNSDKLPYDEFMRHIAGYTAVSDIRHVDGRTFSINIR